MATERLPLAVYGTLRSGFGNHDLLAGRLQRVAPGLVEGYELVIDRIPFARPAPNAKLIVEIVWPTPALYDQVLADVDHLESYNPHRQPSDNLYTRVAVTATTHHDENVPAWLYEAGPHTRSVLPSHLPAVPSGDYANTLTELCQALIEDYDPDTITNQPSDRRLTAAQADSHTNRTLDRLRILYAIRTQIWLQALINSDADLDQLTPHQQSVLRGQRTTLYLVE